MSQVVTDEAWAVWEPLIEEVRSRGKTPPQELRRTLAAIFWRHQNGAKWRSLPAGLGSVVADSAAVYPLGKGDYVAVPADTAVTLP